MDEMRQKSPEEMTPTSKNRKHDYTITPTITRKVAQLHERHHDYTMGMTITRKVAQLHERATSKFILMNLIKKIMVTSKLRRQKLDAKNGL